jgi:hypothetical protein
MELSSDTLGYRGRKRMDKMKLYYTGQDFSSVEAARAHFERKWSGDNPRIARSMSLEDVKKTYEGAHYRDRRWYLYSEINDHRTPDPTSSPSGPDNVIATCPKCGSPGLVRRGGWPETTHYVHVSGKENNRPTDIFVCAIKRDPNELIDASY